MTRKRQERLSRGCMRSEKKARGADDGELVFLGRENDIDFAMGPLATAGPTRCLEKPDGP